MVSSKRTRQTPGGTACKAAGRSERNGAERARGILGRPWFYPSVVFVVALTLRFIYIAQTRNTPFFETLGLDARFYDYWARRLAGGEGYGEPFFMSPLYPYFLAGLYRLFGRDLMLVRAVQAILGAGSAALAYQIACDLFDRRIALLAGLLTACYGALIFYDGSIVMTPLLVFLNLLALWLLVRADVSGRVLLFAGAGAAIGLAAVGRAAVLIFAPLAVLWAGLPVRAGRGGAPNAAVRGERAVRGGAGGPAGAGEGWRRAASLVFGMLMVVAPVTIRNYAVSGDLIPITSNGGLNFYIGNGEIATGGYAKPEGLDIVDDPGGESIAESALGRDLTPSEVSSYWYSRAWYHIGSDVPGWARLLVRKLSFALSSYEFPQLENYDFQRQYSALLSLPLPGFAIVGPLGLVGLAMAMGRRRSRILALFFMGYIASLVVFFVLARYRLPVVPVLAVGASYAVVRAYDMIRAGAVRRVAAPALAVAALAFVVNGNLYSVDRLTPYAQIHYRLGIIYGDRGDVARALNEYRRAIEIDPDYPQSYLNLGALLAREGRLDEAVSVFEEAIGIAPRYANAWLNLGMAQIAGGRLDQAIESLDTAVSLDPGSAAALTQLGVALYRAGREEEALDALSRAESLDDGSERAEIEFYRALATGSTAAEALTEDAARAVARADSLTQRGRAVEAAEVLREASVMAPNSGVPLQRLALLERNMGLLQEAVGHMREALRVEPTIAHGNFMLGVLLNESGRHDAAIRAYEAEVRIDPSYAPAHRNLATAYLYHLADRNRALLHYQEYVRLGGEPVPPLEEALGGADSPGE